jgi:hypothetical protein
MDGIAGVYDRLYSLFVYLSDNGSIDSVAQTYMGIADYGKRPVLSLSREDRQ